MVPKVIKLFVDHEFETIALGQVELSHPEVFDHAPTTRL